MHLAAAATNSNAEIPALPESRPFEGYSIATGKSSESRRLPTLLRIVCSI